MAGRTSRRGHHRTKGVLLYANESYDLCREDEKGIRKKRSANTNSFQTLIQFTSLLSLSEKQRREDGNWCRLSRILSCLCL